MPKDECLVGNERIEEAIAALQSEPTHEMLAHALTVVRRRMREGGHLIPAVNAESELTLGTVRTSDGKQWFAAFTSFEEQMKGGNAVMSAFTSPIENMLRTALTANGVAGLILDPWNRTLMLDKTLIRVVLGDTE